ncbi:MAG: hypothetical protein RLZZ215_1627 [Pseudomonadota bacterium]|jgi:chromosome segregation ATPase
MTITYSSNESGFLVKVPFDLKDAFKAVFKTAKWDSTTKAWQVGVRAEKKIQQFIVDTRAQQAEIEALEAAQAEQDALNYDLKALHAELTKFQADMDAKRQALQDAKALQSQLEESKKALSATQAELAEVAKEVATEHTKAKSQKEDIKAMLTGIIDLDRVFELKRTLENNHVPNDRSKKSRFEAAQQELKKMIAALAEAGIKSHGISAMYQANINRPDRDSVRNISNDRVYLITKVEMQG